MHHGSPDLTSTFTGRPLDQSLQGGGWGDNGDRGLADEGILGAVGGA